MKFVTIPVSILAGALSLFATAVLAQRGQTPNSHTPDCRPNLISPRALARRRQRAWPRLELRAALAHVEAMVPRDADLWPSMAGRIHPRLQRCSLRSK